MGVVYLADNVTTGQRVALKLLTPDLARSSGFRERFVREANYASSMRHPNVIEVFDAGEQDGVLYIAMQYVEGEDLKAVLVREGKLDARRTVGILGQVASALDAAHSTGLMHRDIKPGNVMIAAGQPEHAYLTDFGLSKNPSSDSIALTAQGEFVGTIDYTAPELVLGKQADSRLDVYSLGCLFYECLAGQPPFPRSATWRFSTRTSRTRRRACPPCGLTCRPLWTTWSPRRWRRSRTTASRPARRSSTPRA